MHRILKLSFVFGVVSFVYGCGTPAKPYAQASAEPSATIRFVSESGGTNLGVVRLRGESAGCTCSQDEPEVVGIFGNKALLVPGNANFADKGVDTNEFTVRVPADGSLFRFLLGTPKYTPNYSYVEREDVPARTIRLTYCQAHHSFVPQAGKNYEAVYNAARDQCTFELFVAALEGKQRVQVKTFPMCALRKDNADGISDRIRAYCAASPELYK